MFSESRRWPSSRVISSLHMSRLPHNDFGILLRDYNENRREVVRLRRVPTCCRVDNILTELRGLEP